MTSESTKATSRPRYEYLDVLRGITLISMILYHTLWDVVYIARVDIGWFRTDAAYIWQQSICWTFILLSGFCWSLGWKKLKRGLVVFAAGVLITLVTMIVTPGQRVVFGVLTLLGSCMLLMIPLEKLLHRASPIGGVLLAAGSFLFTKSINRGALGIGELSLIKLPEEWYNYGTIMTYLGFTDRDFFSTDYFSLLPWLFLFITGYFLYRLAVERGVLETQLLMRVRNKPLAFVGRHSLLIYLLHQPVIYLGVTCLTR